MFIKYAFSILYLFLWFPANAHNSTQNLDTFSFDLLVNKDVDSPYYSTDAFADVLLVTVSDDRSGRKQGKYGETQDKIKQIFLNNPDFGIKKFAMWKWDHLLKTNFYQENKVLLDNTHPAINGRAYKPYVILEGLKSLQDGEFLIYSDASPELWSALSQNSIINPLEYNVSVMKDLCTSNNGILTIHVKWNGNKHVRMGEPGFHTHANFTLERCLKKMGLCEYRESLQHASGMWVICKSQETVNLVEEWLYWNLIDECASLGYSHILNDRSFWLEESSSKTGHRHDQSISGLLINRRGNWLVEIPENLFGMNPYNILQYARVGLKYTFMDSNMTNPNFQ